MADAAKKSRTYGKAKFTRYVNVLLVNLDENKELEIIELLVNDVDNSWQEVEGKHHAYLALLSDYEEETEDKWIEELENTHRDARIKYLQRQRQTEHSKYVNRIDLMNMGLEERIGEIDKCIKDKAAVGTIERELKLLDNRFEKLQDQLNNVSQFVDSDLKKKSLHINNRMYTQVNEAAAAYIKAQKELEKQKIRKIKLDKIPLPKFDGNIRLNPKFKSDFEKLILPNVAEEEASFTLRQCLSKVALECVGACEDDVKVMLRKLDDKFGDSCKLVNVIVAEVRGLKRITANDDTKSLINMVNVIEKGYNDLKLFGLEREFCNATVTCEVESKLSHEVSLAWFRKVYDPKSMIDRNDKFQDLLEFLKVERDAREYGYFETTKRVNNSIKESNDIIKSCYIHNSDNHTIGQCYGFLQKNNEERVAFVREKRGCWKCLGQGHLAVECSKKEKCGTNGREKQHHPSLHAADVAGLTFCTEGVLESTISKPCLMAIMEVMSLANEKVNVLWDTAATVSLVTYEKAEVVKLKAIKRVNLRLETAGGNMEERPSTLYRLPIYTQKREIYYIDVYGIDRISTKINSTNLRDFTHVFETNLEDFRISDGEVEVLIGMNYAAYHPQKVEAYGQLVLYETDFGKCVGGSHPHLKNDTQILISNARVNHLNAYSALKYFEIEALGSQKAVGEHAVQGDLEMEQLRNCSLEEVREWLLIAEGMRFENNQ